MVIRDREKPVAVISMRGVRSLPQFQVGPVAVFLFLVNSETATVTATAAAMTAMKIAGIEVTANPFWMLTDLNCATSAVSAPWRFAMLPAKVASVRRTMPEKRP